MLVLVGVRVTASVCVVVVVVAGSFTTVVQEDKAMTQVGITGIKRISFFIVGLMLTKDSPQVVSLDGTSNEFFQASAIGTSRLALLER